MANFLRNYWYVCAWDTEVGSDILARSFLGEPVILFRTEDGTPVALEDRCCHRHLPLSEGRVNGNNIQCGYHGLVFDATGACVEVPGQTLVPPGSVIKSYPVVERHRFVWIWMGAPEAADPADIPDLRWNDTPGWPATGGTIRLACDYQLLLDNLIDLTHETYVHENTLGNLAVVDNPIKTTRDGDSVTVTRWMYDHEPAPFWRNMLGGSGNCDRWQIIRFMMPSIVRLDVGVALTGTGAPEGDRSQGIEGRNYHGVTPETENSCWQFFGFARNFRIDDDGLTENIRRNLLDILTGEDQPVLEAQHRAMRRAPDAPSIDVNADACTIQARRLISEALAAEASL